MQSEDLRQLYERRNLANIWTRDEALMDVGTRHRIELMQLHKIPAIEEELKGYKRKHEKLTLKLIETSEMLDMPCFDT